MNKSLQYERRFDPNAEQYPTCPHCTSENVRPSITEPDHSYCGDCYTRFEYAVWISITQENTQP